MDYQYLNPMQLHTMDYWSLVNMLTSQITPETRKMILDKLSEMNNQLLMGMNMNSIQPDLARSSMLNSRKKDLSETQHPSFDHLNYKGPNPLPLNVPINGNNHFTMTSYHSQVSNANNEINLDEIIDDAQEIPDPLDMKLAYIKKLHTKIVAEKRKRRKEKERK